MPSPVSPRPPRVLVTRPLPPAGRQALAASRLDVVVGEEDLARELPAARLGELAETREAILCHLTEQLSGELLAELPRLRGVAVMATGYDNVDLAAATRLGIPVSNTPGVLVQTTADFAFALLLAVARRLPAAERHLRAGLFARWGADLLVGDDVSPGGDGRRRVLGLVGFGRIGAAMARRAAAFDLEVLAHDPRHGDRIAAAGHRAVALDELLAASDFVSLHAPLRPETHHLIGRRELALMRPGGYLINTARGALVDEAALVEALRAGRLAGTALDVFEREPELAAGLLDLPNVVVAPHVASATHATRGRMAELAVENVVAHANGRPAPHTVNPEVYASDAWRRRRGRP